jgi:guanylate kinase
MKNNGMLVVLSAPSGAGKTTIFRELLARQADLRESIS